MKKTSLFLLIMLSNCINPQDAGNKSQVVKTMASTITKKFSGAPQLTIEAYIKDKSQYILVDVRSEDERAVSQIPGALSKEEFEKKREHFRDKKILSYCTIGQRSSEYTQGLIKAGFDAFNLSESILGWTHRQLPLIDSLGKPTKKVHVYSKAWNLVEDKYQGVWE